MQSVNESTRTTEQISPPLRSTSSNYTDFAAALEVAVAAHSHIAVPVVSSVVQVDADHTGQVVAVQNPTQKAADHMTVELVAVQTRAASLVAVPVDHTG